MGTLHTKVEKQVFEFTVQVFNRLLIYYQEHYPLAPPDWEFIASKLLRLYRVWDIVWKKGGLKETESWRRFFHWMEVSGFLGYVKPILVAEEDVQAELLWKLCTSESFLAWCLTQLGDPSAEISAVSPPPLADASPDNLSGPGR